jgi:hypothetical protein
MTQAEVSALTPTTWPRCCGERLLYYVQIPAPESPNDTTPDMRALPPASPR